MQLHNKSQDIQNNNKIRNDLKEWNIYLYVNRVNQL